MKYKVIKTCSACPEQYDVYLGDRQVGYLRLRHGCFRVDYPDCGGETIYEAFPMGDGEFDDDERDFYINEAIESIDRKIFKKWEYIEEGKNE